MECVSKYNNGECAEITYCFCDTQALEPDESCPVHGGGEFPPRCGHCGRFLPWPEETWTKEELEEAERQADKWSYMLEDSK